MQAYKKLFTYWFSVLVYDLTVQFCQRWVPSWKLKEQMLGAARSGKQNIVEGSENMQTSLKIAINLTGVAKGSIEELIGDLEDYVRQNRLRLWGKADPQTQLLRKKAAELVRNLSNLGNLSDLSLLSYLRGEGFALPTAPEGAANLILTLAHQATYLLHRQGGSPQNQTHARGRAHRGAVPQTG